MQHTFSFQFSSCCPCNYPFISYYCLNPNIFQFPWEFLFLTDYLIYFLTLFCSLSVSLEVCYFTIFSPKSRFYFLSIISFFLVLWPHLCSLRVCTVILSLPSNFNIHSLNSNLSFLSSNIPFVFLRYIAQAFLVEFYLTTIQVQTLLEIVKSLE